MPRFAIPTVSRSISTPGSDSATPCPAGGERRGTRRGCAGRLAAVPGGRHAGVVDEPQGSYRGEVLAIMGALADIYTDTSRILAALGENGEEEDEPEEMDS